MLVNTVEEAFSYKREGRVDACIGERRGRKPVGFDFGNSPALIAKAELSGKTLAQTTTNGTAGMLAAAQAERAFATSLVCADATVAAVLAERPKIVHIVAMGRAGVRADEDELCAMYLRSRLEGRAPDKAAMKAVIASTAPPPATELIAAGDYDRQDRDICLDIGRLPLALPMERDGNHVILRPSFMAGSGADMDPPGGAESSSDALTLGRNEGAE